jgi:hypothetical protein
VVPVAVVLANPFQRSGAGERRPPTSAAARDAEPEFIDPGYLARVAAVGPGLTLALDEIAEAAGGGLWGLAYRYKTVDAIGRKLAGQLRDSPDLTMAEALAALPDAVRYTVGFATPDYASGVGHVLAGLRTKGYRQVWARNMWGAPDRYPGIITCWAEPDTGQLFEVQLHTEESYAVRTGEHEVTYHQILLLLDHDTLLDRLRAALAAVPVPDGAPDIALQDALQI